MATLMIFVSRDPDHFGRWFAALLIAWATAAVILTSASRLSRLLGPRGLAACERLMGIDPDGHLRPNATQRFGILHTVILSC